MHLSHIKLVIFFKWPTPNMSDLYPSHVSFPLDMEKRVFFFFLQKKHAKVITPQVTCPNSFLYKIVSSDPLFPFVWIYMLEAKSKLKCVITSIVNLPYSNVVICLTWCSQMTSKLHIPFSPRSWSKRNSVDV